MKLYKDVITTSTFPSWFEKDLFSDAFSTFGPIMAGDTEVGFPRVNLVDSDSKFIIELGLSGWKKDELVIEVLGDKLVVFGEAKNSSIPEGKYLRRELKRSKFSKTIVLGNNLDRDNIEATYEDGVLTIIVPKKQKSTSKSININIK